jgi:predicted DNA-binding transcriptional regulator AlpA
MKANKPVDRENIEPILLTARQVAALCQVSLSTVGRRHKTGDMPAPNKIGRLVRWSKADIVAWVNDGCPNLN